jgi:hypothetical protein
VNAFFVEVLRECQDGAIRVNTNDLNLRVELLQFSGDTRNLATGTGTNDYIINFPAALIEDFLSSFVVMGQGI